MDTYKLTAGIEVHCELKSKTKMFSDSLNEYHSAPNCNINAIDLAYPGVLPSVNMYGIELALKAALLLNCQIQKRMYFDRKNYFYPDLPKGYQITQARTPIGTDGYVEIMVNDQKKRIRIHDIHIEEDTCKNTHLDTCSLLDFNRSGVPLIEIVTEPDIKSDEEAMLYLEKLRELLLYADISDCKIEEGSMRCDVNVSVSKTDILGIRTETKNVGSIRNVGLVIESEKERQISLLENGETIREETRRYDEKTNQTILMRVKETGNDYRYFPEPDIPPVTLEDTYIEAVKKSLPVMPDERRELYKRAGIQNVNIEKIIQNKMISDYLMDLNHINLVIASNLLLGDVSFYLNKHSKSLWDVAMSKENFESLVTLLDTSKMSSKQVKEILPEILEKNTDVNEILKRDGMTQVTDNTFIKQIVDIVLKENPDSVLEYQSGKDRASKYLMGQVMKQSKGKVNPAIANEILIDTLNRL